MIRQIATGPKDEAYEILEVAENVSQLFIDGARVNGVDGMTMPEAREAAKLHALRSLFGQDADPEVCSVSLHWRTYPR